MSQTQPIVCGTDFSPNAAQAANVAAAIAVRLGAPLLLVHAGAMPLDSAFAEAWLSPVKEQLHQEAERLRAAGAGVEEIFTSGNPDESLVGLARERDAALLIVSSLGRRAPARWLIGSVAARTAETATVPTLVVRDAAPFEAWARGEAPLEVFIGTDFSPSADEALRWLAALRKIAPCHVTAVYADWPPKSGADLSLYGALGLVENEPNAQAVLEKDLRERVTRVIGEEGVRTYVVGNWGAVDHHLISLAQQANASLIVVGTHQWHGIDRLRHGSTSRAILHHAPISVACVPTPPPAATLAPGVQECRRVLIAVDLGANHGYIPPYGYSIVNRGGTVRLVHVDRTLQPIVLPDDPAAWVVQQPEPEEERVRRVAGLEGRLRALAPAAAAQREIQTEVEVIQGTNAARAVCEAAERFDADIVCIGGHTRPGVLAKIMGSQALAILSRCKRPVLIVWPPGENR